MCCVLDSNSNVIAVTYTVQVLCFGLIVCTWLQDLLMVMARFDLLRELCFRESSPLPTVVVSMSAVFY